MGQEMDTTMAAAAQVGRVAARDASRFNAASWCVLAVALLALSTSLACTLYRLSLPSDGWVVHTQAPGQQITFMQKLTDGPSPIQEGDVLVAVAGGPVETIMADAFALRPQRPPNWTVGGTARYTVLRAGREVTLVVPLAALPIGSIPASLGANIVDGLLPLVILLGFALFVFLRRPRDEAARLLFLFCILLPSSALQTGRADFFYPQAYWPEALFDDLWWLFTLTPVVIHLALVFPVKKGFVRRHGPLVLAALYGLAPGAFLVALLFSGDGPSAFWPTFRTFESPWLGLSLLLMVLLAVGHSVWAARDPLARAQVRWVALGIIVGLIGPAVLYSVDVQMGRPALMETLSHLIYLALPVSLGIAILRYQLWDIDVIINRTLAYGTLTLSLVGLYLLIVVGCGALLQAQGNPALALLATALIAVVFAPLREWIQRAVNRLMYGARDDPYGVLAGLGQRLEATLAPEAVLPTIVDTVAGALKLPYAAITLQQGDEERLIAAHGAAREHLLHLPLVYQGTPVGQLLLAPRRPSEAFSAADRRLLDDLARHAGVAAQAVRLTADLQRSRERLVTAREEERRRLRRDLHDGLGPALASATLKLHAARTRLAGDPATAELVAASQAQVEAAVADIRRLVYALRPPALDELGLVPAIREQALHCSTEGLRVAVDAPATLPPLPAALEVATYRIALEALTNVVRHAQAHTCQIGLALTATPSPELRLEVIDDGVGLSAQVQAGVGWMSMRERATELGGTCLIEPGETGGTRVRARWPVPPLEAGVQGV